MENKFMEEAILEAKKAFKKGEVPVGAVIVKNNKIIAKAHNLVERKQNACFRAEIIAITKAAKKIRNWRLSECDLYVTLEPCQMCMGAIKNSRIRNVYYSVNRTDDDKKNNLIFIPEYNETCLNEIQSFFKGRRG